MAEIDMKEKLVELLRGAVHINSENVEKWILGGKQGEIPNIFNTQADHLIAHGVTVQEWISVKDRLPGKGTGHVLVVKQLRGKSYVDMGEVIGETACCYSDEYCINPREHIFTHWMPLPQPPKGE